MSPASAGPLEVERYIGACLISSQHRTKNNQRDVYYPRDRYVHHQDIYNSSYPVTIDNRFRPRRSTPGDGWAGGMPLISFANHHRRNRRQEPNDNTQKPEESTNNTPLSRLAVHTQGLPLILSGRHNNRRNKTNTRNQQQCRNDGPPKKDSSVRPVDALSIASDESSGSNNSETTLPRIIKPRKRRKKDRKPRAPEESLCNTNTNIVTLKPYVVPYCYTRDRTFPPNYNFSDSKTVVDKCVDELSEAPQLHHRFEDLEGLDTEVEQQVVSSCQCRLCDPSGQIWDVDRHCYSPFLTSPKPETYSRKYVADKISVALENQCLISPNYAEKEVYPRTRQCLEISTEIVTSHNGHRDLEIRLFSQMAVKDKLDTSDKCISSERVCSVSDDCGLTPEE